MSDGKAEILPLSEGQQVRELYKYAIDKGTAGVEALDKLMELHERIEKRNAAKEFNDAMARFQEACPELPKSSKATIAPRGGIKFSYNFADLDSIARIIRKPLYENGLSYSWDEETVSGNLTSTCIVHHINGHERRSSFTCPSEWSSGSMSAQQKVAATNSFARRQSLIQVLGLTTTELDNDGGPIGEMITDKQAADLEAIISEVGADRDRFLKYLEVDDLGALPVTQFSAAVAALERKRQAP